jgi:hypothetical protein
MREALRRELLGRKIGMAKDGIEPPTQGSSVAKAIRITH